MAISVLILTLIKKAFFFVAFVTDGVIEIPASSSSAEEFSAEWCKRVKKDKRDGRANGITCKRVFFPVSDYQEIRREI